MSTINYYSCVFICLFLLFASLYGLESTNKTLEGSRSFYIEQINSLNEKIEKEGADFHIMYRRAKAHHKLGSNSQAILDYRASLKMTRLEPFDLHEVLFVHEGLADVFAEEGSLTNSSILYHMVFHDQKYDSVLGLKYLNSLLKIKNIDKAKKTHSRLTQLKPFDKSLCEIALNEIYDDKKSQGYKKSYTRKITLDNVLAFSYLTNLEVDSFQYFEMTKVSEKTKEGSFSLTCDLEGEQLKRNEILERGKKIISDGYSKKVSKEKYSQIDIICFVPDEFFLLPSKKIRIRFKCKYTLHVPPDK